MPFVTRMDHGGIVLSEIRQTEKTNSVWSLPSTISQSLLKFMSIKLVRPSNHLILCLPLFLLPSVFPSIRIFSGELALCIRWPKYWSFSFSISTSSEQSWFPLGLIGLNALLSKGLSRVFSRTTVWKDQFFDAQLFYGPILTSIHDYWKNHSFDSTDLLMSLLFNTLSSLSQFSFQGASIF